MTYRFLRSLGVIFLASVFLYSGVAWAIKGCLRHEIGIDPQSISYENLSSPGSGTDPAVLSSPFAHHPASELHCLDSRYPIGPIAQIQAGQQLVDGFRLKLSLSPGSLLSDKAGFWPEGRFGQGFFFSSLRSLSYPLFLSVLRI